MPTIDPGTAIVAAGTAGLADGIISSAFNAFQANKQQNFQERMSSTAHQREVSDLRKAGLNPILSARHGGASAPAGSSAQAVSPDIAGKGIAAAQAASQIKLQDANSALATAQAGDIGLTQQARIDSMIAQKELALSTAGKQGGADTDKIRQEIVNLRQQKELIKNETSHSAYGLHKAKAESVPYKVLNEAIEKPKSTWDNIKGKARKWFDNRTRKMDQRTGRW